MDVATMANKNTIYDTCRLCHSILSILKPVFVKFDRFITL